VVRSFRFAFLGLIALVVSTVPARAITITDTFDPTDQYFSPSGGTCTGTNPTGTASDSISGQTAGGCDSLGFLQDISALYSVPPPLTSATLDLYFYDNVDPGQGNPEEVRVTVDLGQSLAVDKTITSGSTSSTADQFTFDVLTYLTDGKLNVYLQRGDFGGGQNDFYFGKAILNADWPGDNETPLPEPATLVLFGGGLGAAVLRQLRRRRTSSNS
jgi:hypothetical protein